jgi:LPXTG-motif cell wall-anchored protein
MNHSPRPSFLRSSIGRVAVTGAATLATAFAVSPAAFATADDVAPEAQTSETQTSEAAAPETEPPETAETPAPEVTDAPPAEDPTEPETTEPETTEPETTEPEAVAPKLVEREPKSAPAAAAEADVEYASQQFSIAVQTSESGYYPNGTSTLGSEISIAVTDADGTTTMTCTTSKPAVDPASTLTACLDGEGEAASELFDLAPGATAVITQTRAAGDLAASDEVTTIEPVEVTPPPLDLLRSAAGGPIALALAMPTTNVVFTNTGPLPTTSNLTANSTDGETIIIDPLENDEVGDPNTVLTITTPPEEGTANVITRPSDESDGLLRAMRPDEVIQYTPNDGYEGPDSVGFTVANSNGSSSGTASIEVSAEPLEANFGSQKYRIGVQIADGSYVPAGATTAGSTFTIETTSQGGVTTTTTCTTGGVTEPDSYSWCPGEVLVIPGGPTASIATYSAPAGATVKVTQTTVPDDALVPAADPMVIEPCDQNVASCDQTINLVFADRGSILPDATDDSASTDAGEPVDIDVLNNDDSADPNTELSISAAPSGGTAEVIGSPEPTDEPADLPTGIPTGIPTVLAVASAVASDGTLAVRYTPDAGFSGVDTFTYALTNGNGVTDATVTVTVRGGVVIDSTADTDSGSGSGSGSDTPRDNGILPDTGGSNATLLGLGALLVAAGGALVGRNRRRPQDTHLG